MAVQGAPQVYPIAHRPQYQTDLPYQTGAPPLMNGNGLENGYHRVYVDQKGYVSERPPVRYHSMPAGQPVQPMARQIIHASGRPVQMMTIQGQQPVMYAPAPPTMTNGAGPRYQQIAYVQGPPMPSRPPQQPVYVQEYSEPVYESNMIGTGPPQYKTELPPRRYIENPAVGMPPPNGPMASNGMMNVQAPLMNGQALQMNGQSRQDGRIPHIAPLNAPLENGDALPPIQQTVRYLSIADNPGYAQSMPNGYMINPSPNGQAAPLSQPPVRTSVPPNGTSQNGWS